MMTARELLSAPQNNAVNRQDLLDWYDGMGQQLDATQANLNRLTGFKKATLDIQQEDPTVDEILDSEFIEFPF